MPETTAGMPTDSGARSVGNTRHAAKFTGCYQVAFVVFAAVNKPLILANYREADTIAKQKCRWTGEWADEWTSASGVRLQGEPIPLKRHLQVVHGSRLAQAHRLAH